MASTRQPDAVVAIDFGMECTKVAILYKSGAGVVTQVMEFYGEVQQKVLRTCIAYRGDKVVAIGDEALRASLDSGADVYRWFKISALKESAEYPKLVDSETGKASKSAGMLCIDFLSALLRKVAHSYEKLCEKKTRDDKMALTPWDNLVVDFVFSAPSVLGTKACDRLIRLARDAGLQSHDGRLQVCDIEIAEPEAASLQVLQKIGGEIKNGDSLLVVDAGGGTTDLSLLSIVDKASGRLCNDHLVPVSSEKFGGAYIDQAFKDMACRLLSSGGVPHLEARRQALHLVTSSGFLDFKYSLDGSADDAMVAHIHGLEKVSTSWKDGMCITNGRLQVERAVLRRLFNLQIFGGNDLGGIVGQVKDMRDDVVMSAPSQRRQLRGKPRLGPLDHTHVEKLDFVIFSGGFSQSQYLRERVIAAVGEDVDLRLKDLGLNECTEGTRFRMAEDAQLCVCKGLLLHHASRLATPAPLVEPKRPKFWFSMSSVFGRK